MNATLYIKPNVIGIQFSTPKERDLFWTLLGENRVAAEMFGTKSVRLHPDKASNLFQIPLNGDKIQVIGVEPEKTAPAKVDVPVSVTALKALEPMPAIGSLPPEVTGEPVAVAAPVVEATLPSPELIPIPQVASVLNPQSSVTDPRPFPDTSQIKMGDEVLKSRYVSPEEIEKAVGKDPKPVGVHHMSKEMREWRARNPKV